ncbi:MAG: dTMP kinase [Firmicutes bacterium]|nr:dTMP kinase [Bacillota bacterium]
MSGFFITFEGPDGVGKTTQLNLLAKYFKQKGMKVRCTREPGGTAIGGKIRNLLLDPAHKGMSARTEALLYMADRAQHVSEVIVPALAGGEVVISDRFADSTIVYQGAARKLNGKDLAMINDFAAQGVTPDLTILLDGEVRLLSKRLAGRGGHDRIEQENYAFHLAVRQGFLDRAAAEPQRIKVVPSGIDISEVHQKVVGIVEKFLVEGAGHED